MEEEIKELEKHIYVKPLYVWDGSFSYDIPPFQYSISICTTCMNRLNDLKETLPKNIKSNSDYPNVEFVVLDYNSTDKIEDWMKKEMIDHIWSGKLKFLQTKEPQQYSMTHSRNIAFRAASGSIVLNVDADNYTNDHFATFINRLANEQQYNAIFAKGKRMIRGRIGFWKHEFTDILGGYDENIEDYGHDDHDLIYRAYNLGFRLMYYGGQFYSNCGSPKHQTENMKNQDWKTTEIRNKLISHQNIYNKIFKANHNNKWGYVNDLIKNFERKIDL